MPPKRKAAASSKALGKKIKEEQTAKAEEKQQPEATDVEQGDDESASGVQEAQESSADVVQVEEAAAGPSGLQVVEDYDCMLNQTNIGNNNNKFYVIQVLKSTVYFCRTRWGRVGEVGKSNDGDFTTKEEAIQEFEKKFKEKTRNNWSDRQTFETSPGKYTLIEVEVDGDAEVDTVDAAQPKVPSNVLPCALDVPTQKLIDLIFSKQMFQEAIEAMKLDIKKMPLGRLSKSQIAKGFEVLEEIEEEVKSGSNQKSLEELSDDFYTIIPHNFGRCRPPVIMDAEVIQTKKKNLLVLADIEVAQSLQAESGKPQEVETVPHPLDKDYQSLNCTLSSLKSDTEEFKVIQKYLDANAGNMKPKIVENEVVEDYDCMLNQTNIGNNNNKFYVIQVLKSTVYFCRTRWGRVGEVGKSNDGDFTTKEEAIQEFEKKFKEQTRNNWSDRQTFETSPGKPKIVDVWKVDRETEAERFKKYDHLENRRLLMHGTNVASVAAILKEGLRIMPHSGGRVGKGLYFASEYCLSADYAEPSQGFRLMFLNEVALGKEHTITKDDSSLKKPPPGFDSVVARGSQEPDPSKDIFITLDGKEVAVPLGPAIKQPKYKGSHFKRSEYLVYQESQCCMRYLLKLKM